jgi:phytoene dehydrogenase-like protein
MEAQAARTDVVVVGGGMAGLTAACYLARAGVAVTLFEKAPGLGGRAATQDYEGYRFNRGIHALYTGGAASEVLQELGIVYRHGRPGTVFALERGRFDLLPTSPTALLRSGLLGAGDKVALVRLLATLPRLEARAFARLTVQEWLEQAIERAAVRRVIAAVARTLVYSAALDLVSAEVFIDRLQRSLRHPIHYLDGGWQALVDALRRAAEGAGARIVSSARVEAVEHAAGEVQGVRLRGGSLVPAAAVVLATTPAEAVRLVDSAAHPALRALVDALVPAPVASLDVALRRLPSTRHTIVQDLEQPLFLSAQSCYAQVAPAGGALVSAFKQLDPRQAPAAQADERDLEALLDAAQPGWRDLLVKRVYLPRIEAVGTLPTAASGGFAGRPSIQAPGLAQLYLAGDWVGPEGFLVDASMASARQVAQLVRQTVTAGRVGDNRPVVLARRAS